MNFAITGASGYLGGELSNYLESKGHKVLRLYRKDVNLQKPNLDFGNVKIDTIIHCAFDKNIKKDNEYIETNINGSIELFKYSENLGIHIIFISSISAMLNNLSKYSSAKLQLENYLMNSKESISIRPGLIIGGSNQGGMLGLLERAVNRMPFIPVPGGDTNIYICNIHTLFRIVEFVGCERVSRDIPLLICEPNPIKFIDLIRKIAKQKKSKSIIFPINIKLIYLLIRTMECLAINIGFKSDNLLGIMRSPTDSHVKSELELTKKFLGIEW